MQLVSGPLQRQLRDALAYIKNRVIVERIVEYAQQGMPGRLRSPRVEWVARQGMPSRLESVGIAKSESQGMPVRTKAPLRGSERLPGHACVCGIAVGEGNCPPGHAWA